VGKKYHGMTVEEHLHHGKTVVEIKRIARDLLDECGAKFGKSNRATRYVLNLCDDLTRLQSALDDEYLKVATEEDLSKHHFPYYERAMVRDD
jgi:hypothetical protein